MIKLIKAGVFDSAQIFKNMTVTPKRYNQQYEIELYISGEGESVIDGTSYKHEKGNLIFARPGQIRYSKNRFLCFYIHVLLDNETEAFLSDIPTMMNVIDFAAYKLCYTEIIRLYESEEKPPLLLQSKLFELLNLIISEHKMVCKGTEYKISPKIIIDAIDFINQNYAKRIFLKDIANHVSFSPIYFHNMFKSYTGKTPHEFLLEKRLENAKLYLLTTELSLGEIVEKCGFSSNSNFDYNFKRSFGMTPSDFRKRKYVL